MSWKDFVDDSIGSMPLNPTIANIPSMRPDVNRNRKKFRCKDLRIG